MTIPAVGLAPQGLVVDSAGGRLFVQNFMSRTVSVYDIRALLSGREYTAPELKVIQTVEKERLLDQILLGKQIFYNAADTRMSKDGYLSCASCHLDGGSDRRVWDFTDRGEGLRKTVSLLGRAGMGHGPVHWSANFDEIQDFENDIRGPFGGTGFMKDEDFHSDGRDRTLGGRKAGVSKELDALSSYVTSLKKVHASPFRQPDGSMTDEGRQGEMIFNREDVGCVRCHVPPLFTDSRLIPSPDSVRGKQDSVAGDIFTLEGFRLHDVGTLKPASGRRLNDTLRGLDTPTLKGIWETPPFLHDGSAATLEDLLTTANPQDKHGHTSQLSIRERGQLVAYLKQLDEGSSVARLGPHSNSRSKLRFTVTYVPAPGGYRLELELPRMSQMPSLVFHNLSGRVVATFSEKTLRDAEFMPGRLLLTWNGRDSHGNKMPPGLYSATACLSGDCQARNLIFIY